MASCCNLIALWDLFTTELNKIPEIQHGTGRRWHSYPWGAVSCFDYQNLKPQECVLLIWAVKKKKETTMTLGGL